MRITIYVRIALARLPDPLAFISEKELALGLGYREQVAGVVFVPAARTSETSKSSIGR